MFYCRDSPDHTRRLVQQALDEARVKRDQERGAEIFKMLQNLPSEVRAVSNTTLLTMYLRQLETLQNAIENRLAEIDG